MNAEPSPPGAEPRSAEVLVDDRDREWPWTDASIRLAAASPFYWLATVHPAGRPHIRPVLAVMVDGLMHTTSGAGARKARNLVSNPKVSLATSTPGMDLVVEGTMQRVTDRGRLRRVADEYQRKYEWPPVVREDGAFDAPYGAPTAGPPPYDCFQILPDRVFGLGTDEEHAPRTTRWTF